MKFAPASDLPSHVKPFVGVPRLGTGVVEADVGAGVVVDTGLGAELLAVETSLTAAGAVSRPSANVPPNTRPSPTTTAATGNQRGVDRVGLWGGTGGGAGDDHAGPGPCCVFGP